MGSDYFLIDYGIYISEIKLIWQHHIPLSYALVACLPTYRVVHKMIYGLKHKQHGSHTKWLIVYICIAPLTLI